MKTLFAFIAATIVFSAASAQIRIGGKTLDQRSSKIVEAAADVATAVTLSDRDIYNLSREAVEWMDEHNPIAGEDTPWGERLKRLTEGITEVNGLELNFKVYHVIDINAFACGDGSIRVFSSLMDIMEDDELMAIIGHEIGHVVNTDVKDAIKTAYLTSAAINAAGAAGGTVGQLTDSQLGELVQSFTGAQFSQKQENAADDYGFRFAIDNGYSPYAMANSLKKLLEISQGEKAPAIQQMFSSHPDTEKRSERMTEKADKYAAENGL